MPALELNGETISFERAGAGTPVLLLHSLGTHAGLWASTLAALSDRFDLVAMDCRGHGGSSNRTGFSVEAIARDGLALMAALGHQRFHVAGCSMGGLFAVALHALAPLRCLSLTLAGAYATVGAAGPPRIATTRETLATMPMAEFGRRYADDTVISADSGARKLVAHAIAAMTCGDYLQTLEAILTADVSPLLAQIAVPTLVLVGTADMRAPPVVVRSLAGSIAGAVFREIEGAGHLMLDEAVAFDQQLRAFLLGRQGGGVQPGL
ncbi:MAG TPA: alpha/beta fold hydrolase [Bosea sp. (in: a-proteobacteria)]|jgi:pimeloyl-ACP methyl ester carboxylesterase|nr:alpha/beta fold hydrolase [Bosea sp. (in: a-proteobacteria)]